jgi:hypothetical protein
VLSAPLHNRCAATGVTKTSLDEGKPTQCRAVCSVKGHKMGLREKISLCIGLLVLFGAFCPVLAQSGAPKFEVYPSWPKPLPENWVTGQISGVCVDNQDHVFIINRNNITDKEAELGMKVIKRT